MLRFKTLVGISIALAGVLAASVSGVLAARGPGHQGNGGQGLVGYGTLSSISAGSATIATPNNGSLTVTLASQATYTARSQAAATAGLKTGVQVAAYGSSVNGVATARSLDYDASPFVAVTLRYTGTVASSSASALTLTTSNGSVTVQLTSATRYQVNGATSSTAPAFNTGQQVRVSAAQYTDGSLVAQLVTIPSAATAAATSTATP